MQEQRPTQPTFRIGHTLRLSTFQIGSAMGDILVTSIWNRIMITHFGIPAMPVSFLIALRYLLSPLSLWAGFLSDTKPLWGMRRTSYIWIGRGLMVISLPLLGLSLSRFDLSPTDLLGWLYATLSSLLYGIGTLISGSPYLALVRDSAPKERQGLAISIAETVLIIFFAIAGITFSLWMHLYNEAIFWQILWATLFIGAFFWFFAIFGAEEHIVKESNSEATVQKVSNQRISNQGDFIRILRIVWQDQRTRQFFIFLSLATFSAWMQDVILEPFGGEVFDLPISRTTRLNSYWQGATVITLVASAFLWRKRPPEQQVGITSIGLTLMSLGMLALGLLSWQEQLRFLEVALLIFGGGFGIYTFGGLSLMAVMCSDKEAGIYLGLWTISILLFKGLGTLFGGTLRDTFLLGLTMSASLGYAIIFIIAGVGLLGSVLLLSRLDVLGYARDTGRVMSRSEIQVATAD